MLLKIAETQPLDKFTLKQWLTVLSLLGILGQLRYIPENWKYLNSKSFFAGRGFEKRPDFRYM